MKAISISVILLFGYISIHAQQPCGGIYYNISDFCAKQISIPAFSQFGRKAVVISDFFLRPYVYIKTEKGRMKVHEDSIYAVQYCNGDIYRIWERSAYLLEETGQLDIYSYTYLGKVKVRTSRGTRLKQKQITDYYFSENDTSEILPLTLTNVRLALLMDKKLDNELIQSFSNDSLLKAKQNSQFKINQFISSKLSN
jgi:hypothetical protein